ncbi:MAG TPA: tail fiber domain-containing protein [Candidatus Gracilibacteria bacterium]
MYKPKLWLSWLMLTALLFSNVASAAVVLDGPNSQLSIGGNTGSAGQLLKVGSGGALEYGAIEAAGIANSSVTAEKLSIALTTTARDLLTPAAGMVVYNTTDSELQVYNGSSWVAAIVDTDTDTTYTAGTGLTLTGTVFSNDLGATIETGEITDGTIAFGDLSVTTAYVTSGIDSVTGGDLLVTEAAVEAYVAANGDDLGNHTATQILVMGANKIVNTDDANDYGIAIGATGTLTTDNALTVTTGGADITGLLAVTGNITATGTITSTSDIAFKENVATVANPIQTLVALRGVQWDWKDDFAAATGQDGDLVTYGVIAQELETVLPSMVVTDNEGHKSVAYNQLTAFLIEAGKAQQTEIEALQARLNYLESLLLNVASAQ